MGKGFCSSPGGQCVLVGAARPLDVAGIGLGQTSGDQAAQEVTDDNPPYPPVRFLEYCIKLYYIYYFKLYLLYIVLN